MALDAGRSEAASRRELSVRLAESLESLPSTYRKVLVARLLDERSYADIAVETGVKENTLAQQMQRGLALWRQELGSDPMTVL